MFGGLTCAIPYRVSPGFSSIDAGMHVRAAALHRRSPPFSRIRRNLSIHIARFSASESPRAHTNTPKNPHFSLVAGTSPGAMRRGRD